MTVNADTAHAEVDTASVLPDAPWRERTAFAVMTVIWGCTWIAIKAGVTAVPPFLFAGTRFTVAGALLLAGLAATRRLRPIARSDLPRLAAVSLLVIAATYGFLFWGVRHVPSGLAGVINLALMPVALLALSLAHGEERFRWAMLLAIAFGVAGLLVLFAPSLDVRATAVLRCGLLAVAASPLTYAWGTVLNRRLLRRYGTAQLSGMQVLLGGVVLCSLALALEPVDAAAWRAFAQPAVLAGWLFLVLGGSLVAFTLYMHLVRVWGSTRAGMYAFVSPVVALMLGNLVYGEPLTASNLSGSALVLGAAWLALRR